jgi:hypothetical protein
MFLVTHHAHSRIYKTQHKNGKENSVVLVPKCKCSDCCKDYSTICHFTLDSTYEEAIGNSRARTIYMTVIADWLMLNAVDGLQNRVLF